MTVCEGSSIVGKTLEESEIRLKYGLIIVAVKKVRADDFQPCEDLHDRTRGQTHAMGRTRRGAPFPGLLA